MSERVSNRSLNRFPDRPSSRFRARKRLGQNFLVDRNVLAEIVERARVSPDDVILEIGPGQGILTRALLLAGCARVCAVELDERLKEPLEALRGEFPDRLALRFEDAVRTDYEAFSPFPNKVVANIPYNITTPLIWKLLAFAGRGLVRHLYMVQKEAADRLTAARDTKERYPLGVTLEATGSVKIVRAVPPTCFRPVPRVDSALVEIRLERNFHLTRDSLWRDLLHVCFRQRRKTLANNLKGFRDIDDWRFLLEEIGTDPRLRAEDLSCEEWLRLYASVSATERPKDGV